jgi:predicted nucleic acid-binding Zn ribbon protein
MTHCKRPKCGKAFESDDPRQQYCSANCRKYHSAEQKKAGNSTMPAVVKVKASKIDPKPVITVVKKAIELTSHSKLPPAGLDKAATLRWFKEH